MRRLPLLYVLGCTTWAAYIIQDLASFHMSHPEARLSGALLCVLLVVVLPSLLGDLLLFRAFPWVGRLIRR
jgi:drug/metabolite transporter (DMT)-like permease